MSSNGLVIVCVVLLSLLLAPSTSVSDDRVLSQSKGEFYTNSWAVEVAGGRAVADDVATRHGFVNVGQAGSLKDIYHFIHAFSPSRPKRSLDAPHQSLLTDSRVRPLAGYTIELGVAGLTLYICLQWCCLFSWPSV
jgi:hypothetical protein